MSKEETVVDTPFPDADVEWHDPLPRNVPRQTYTPAVLSLGLTLFFWGALTSWILGLTGFILISLGIAGWTRELVWQSQHPDGGHEHG